MISPIYPFVSKRQALELIPKERREKIPRLELKATVVYSLIWIPCNTLFIVLEISPVAVIGFISTVMAFFCTYLFPVMMTFKVGDYVRKEVVKASWKGEQVGRVESNQLESNLMNPEKGT